MDSEKVVMEKILDRQPQESVVMVGRGRKGSEVVDVKIRNRRFAKSENKSIYSPPKIISFLCVVIMVQV